MVSLAELESVRLRPAEVREEVLVSIRVILRIELQVDQ
jgi:hypothetical protein